MKRPVLFACLLALCLCAVAGIAWQWRAKPESLRAAFAPRETVWQRPHGMAPQAFEAFLRACRQTGISPARIGQTIGDHPRSVGYHRRDGVLKIKGEEIEYTAAVDVGAFELPEWQRQKFLRALARNGFAAWYRSGPKWKDGEHIHAIYASLPMKPQLRGQVMEWLRDRRIARAKPHAWEVKLRRRWGLRRV